MVYYKVKEKIDFDRRALACIDMSRECLNSNNKIYALNKLTKNILLKHFASIKVKTGTWKNGFPKKHSNSS